MDMKIEIKCPECGCQDFDVYDTDGGLEDGWMEFKCCCLNDSCESLFEVKTKLEIEEL